MFLKAVTPISVLTIVELAQECDFFLRYEKADYGHVS